MREDVRKTLQDKFKNNINKKLFSSKDNDWWFGYFWRERGRERERKINCWIELKIRVVIAIER